VKGAHKSATTVCCCKILWSYLLLQTAKQNFVPGKIYLLNNHLTIQSSEVLEITVFSSAGRANGIDRQKPSICLQTAYLDIFLPDSPSLENIILKTYLTFNWNIQRQLVH